MERSPLERSPTLPLRRPSSLHSVCVAWRREARVRGGDWGGYEGGEERGTVVVWFACVYLELSCVGWAGGRMFAPSRGSELERLLSSQAPGGSEDGDAKPRSKPRAVPRAVPRVVARPPGVAAAAAAAAEAKARAEAEAEAEAEAVAEVEAKALAEAAASTAADEVAEQGEVGAVKASVEAGWGLGGDVEGVARAALGVAGARGGQGEDVGIGAGQGGAGVASRKRGREGEGAGEAHTEEARDVEQRPQGGAALKVTFDAQVTRVEFPHGDGAGGDEDGAGVPHTAVPLGGAGPSGPSGPSPRMRAKQRKEVGAAASQARVLSQVRAARADAALGAAEAAMPTDVAGYDPKAGDVDLQSMTLQEILRHSAAVERSVKKKRREEAAAAEKKLIGPGGGEDESGNSGTGGPGARAGSGARRGGRASSSGRPAGGALSRYGEDGQAMPAEAGAPASLAPQVHIIDGKIVVDDATLTVTATRESETGSFRRIVESGTILNSSTYSNRIKPERWSVEDTDKFFRCLTMFGSNFTLIANLFPTRNRRQIKNKFTAEDRRDPARITKCLEAKKHPIGEALVMELRDGLPGTAEDLSSFMEQLKAGGLSGSDVADRDGARSDERRKHRSSSPQTVPLNIRVEEGELLPIDEDEAPDADADAVSVPIVAAEETVVVGEQGQFLGSARDSPSAVDATTSDASRGSKEAGKFAPPSRRRSRTGAPRVPEPTPAVVEQVLGRSTRRVSLPGDMPPEGQASAKPAPKGGRGSRR